MKPTLLENLLPIFLVFKVLTIMGIGIVGCMKKPRSGWIMLMISQAFASLEIALNYAIGFYIGQLSSNYDRFEEMMRLIRVSSYIRTFFNFLEVAFILIGVGLLLHQMSKVSKGQLIYNK